MNLSRLTAENVKLIDGEMARNLLGVERKTFFSLLHHGELRASRKKRGGKLLRHLFFGVSDVMATKQCRDAKREHAVEPVAACHVESLVRSFEQVTNVADDSDFVVQEPVVEAQVQQAEATPVAPPLVIEAPAPQPTESSMKMIDGEMLTSGQASELFGSTRSSFDGYVFRGAIPGKKVDGRLMFRRADVVAFKEARAEDATKMEAENATKASNADVLTFGEARDLIGVSDGALAGRIQRGDLPYKKVDGSRTFRRVDVIALKELLAETAGGRKVVKAGVRKAVKADAGGALYAARCANIAKGRKVLKTLRAEKKAETAPGTASITTIKTVDGIEQVGAVLMFKPTALSLSPKDAAMLKKVVGHAGKLVAADIARVEVLALVNEGVNNPFQAIVDGFKAGSVIELA